MANIEYGLLKLAAAKASGLVFPIGLVAVATIWAWRVRDRQPASAHSEARPASVRTRQGSGAGHRADAVGSDRDPTSFTPARGASQGGSQYGGGREALLNRIIEDNIQLREALKASRGA